MARHHLTWDDLTPVEFEGGSRKWMIDGAGGQFTRVHVPAGTKAAAHQHPFEQLVAVISGKGFLETSQGRVRFDAGSVFHLPPETWHAADFETDSVLVEVNIGV